jgi:hypothetical protein
VTAQEAGVVGVIVLTTLPALSPATHKVADEQDTLSRAWPLSTVAGADQEDVGLVEVSTLPAPSTATHRDTEGHEIPKMLKVSTLATDHEPATVGVVEVTMLPALSPATQSDADGHEIDWRPEGPGEASMVVGAAHESGCEATAGLAKMPITADALAARIKARSKARRGDAV